MADTSGVVSLYVVPEKGIMCQAKCKNSSNDIFAITCDIMWNLLTSPSSLMTGVNSILHLWSVHYLSFPIEGKAQRNFNCNMSWFVCPPQLMSVTSIKKSNENTKSHLRPAVHSEIKFYEESYYVKKSKLGIWHTSPARRNAKNFPFHSTLSLLPDILPRSRFGLAISFMQNSSLFMWQPQLEIRDHHGSIRKNNGVSRRLRQEQRCQRRDHRAWHDGVRCYAGGGCARTCCTPAWRRTSDRSLTRWWGSWWGRSWPRLGTMSALPVFYISIMVESN